MSRGLDRGQGTRCTPFVCENKSNSYHYRVLLISMQLSVKFKLLLRDPPNLFICLKGALLFPATIKKCFRNSFEVPSLRLPSISTHSLMNSVRGWLWLSLTYLSKRRTYVEYFICVHSFPCLASVRSLYFYFTCSPYVCAWVVAWKGWMKSKGGCV